MRIDDDRYIPGLSELTQVIHNTRLSNLMQMNHDVPSSSMAGTSGHFPNPDCGLFTMVIKSENDFHNEESAC
jgi:hypothetical protein